MADTKSTHVAQVKFQSSGLENITKPFDDLKKLNITKSMELKIESVKNLVLRYVNEANQQISTGVINISKLNTSKVSAAFGSLFNELQKQADKGLFGGKTFQGIDKDIVKLQEEIDDLNKIIGESSNKVSTLKSELTALRQTKDIKEPYKSEKARLERISWLDQKKDDPKFNEERRKGYNQELKALKKYHEDYKKINEAIISETEKQVKTREKVAQKSQEVVDRVKEQRSAPNEVQEVAALNNVYEELIGLLQKINNIYNEKGAKQNAQDNKEAVEEVKKVNNAEKEHNKTLGKKIATSFSYYVIFNKIRQLYRDMIRTITELDKAMTTVAMVTSMNRQEAWKLLGTYQSLAKEVGITTSEIANLSVYFFRQGRNVKDALILTEIAAKSARVAGIAAEEAANYLTSAVNGFGLAAEQASEVADKFAQLAANSASSFEELAIAMSKVAPVAQSAGISIDFMMGVLAKGIETTREAPENIGTAFKTVFARMREITDIGKAVEDGMSVNRVEKALASIGVALRDTSGQFRNLEDVLMEVGYKWNELSSIEQAYLATALAGTRQQPRLLAIFNDFERTVELIKVSKESANAMSMQHIEYMEGMEAATANLKTAWEEFITTFASSEVIIGIFKGLGSTISSLADGFSKLGTAGQLMITMLTTLTAALMISKIGFVAGTIASIKNTAAKIANALALRYLTREQIKNAAAQGPGIVLTYAQAKANAVASLSNMTLAGTLKAVGAGLWASLGPIALVVAAIAGMVGIISLVVKQYREAKKGLEDYNNEIQKNNKLIYENSQKSQSLEKIISEYEKLNNKLVKTKEELTRIKQLQSELAEFDIGDDENNFTQTFGDRTIVNTAAIDEYQRNIRERNSNILKQNMDSIREALLKDLNISSSPTMIATLNDFGYDIVNQTIEGIEDANLKNKINSSFVEAFSDINYDNFIINAPLAKSRRDATKQGFSAKLLDTELLEKLHKYRLELLTDFYTKQAKNEEDNSDNMKKLLETNLILYNEKLKEIRENLDFSEEVRFSMIASLEYSMRDEANLKALIEDRKVPIDLIVKSIQFKGTLSDIEKITEKLFTSIDLSSSLTSIDFSIMGNIAMPEEFFDTSKIIDQQFIAKEMIKQKSMSMITDILNADSSNIAASIAKFRTYLLNTAKMDAEAADSLIDDIINNKTKTAENLMSNILDTKKLAEGFTTMFENMAKGDFSNFAELSEEFELENIQAFIAGEKTINEIMEEKVLIYKEEIKLRIEALKIMANRSDIEEIELSQLELMYNNYDLLNISAISRNDTLQKTLSIIQKMNSALSIQSKLLDMGFDKNSEIYKFFKEFSDISAELSTKGMETTIDKYSKDLSDLTARMLEEGIVDENFNLINLDNMTSTQAILFASYQNMMEEFASMTEEYLDYISSIYKDEQNRINEMYDNEINLIKEANTERWREIEYANSLLDIQDKVISAREKLLGLTLEGSSKGTIEQARKDLQSLQRERQKMIEQQMVEEAEKQLEKDRQDALAKLQQDQIDAMSSLTTNIRDLNLTISKSLNKQNVPTHPNWLGGGPSFDFLD